ncbi:MAG: response regulator [Rhodospirillales bacterium]|nr:response regulator [Rhodospirillales bacterium]
MAKILIAEDDSSMRHFLGAALRRAGHDVDVCADGREALAVLMAETDHDLLLTDIVMPGMDGIELAQKAAALKPAMSVMFITGFAAVAMGGQTQPPSNARLLSKPFHLKDLVDQVDRLLAA